MIAALYVDPHGAYSGLADVDLWDEARDARLYPGPWPVVAHPPCNRWSIMALARPELTIGDDGGCFAAALGAVRAYGGVLEHPAFTLAWRHFALPRPTAHGWQQSLFDDGWVCQVDQSFYGHPMRKLTWLYAYGCELPDLQLGDGGTRAQSIAGLPGSRQAERSATPSAFRDVLIAMARSALVPA